MKFNLTICLLVIVFIVACFTDKVTLNHTGNKYEAIENVIRVYSHQSKRQFKEFNLFRIRDSTKLEQPYYSYYIMPIGNFYSIRKNDTLGSYTEHFPTNFTKYKDKLFVWIDSEKPLEMDILHELNSIGKLDSIHLRYELGIYIDPWDTIDDWNLIGKIEIENPNPPLPEVRTDERLRGAKYIVCKDHIDRIENITGKFDDAVNLNCEE